MALRENLDDCLKWYSQLQNEPDIQKSYASLQKATLLCAVCYNKKCGAEVSEILKQDFTSGKKDEKNWSENNELFNTMTKGEQEMALKTLVLTVRGKQSKYSYLILDEQLITAL